MKTGDQNATDSADVRAALIAAGAWSLSALALDGGADTLFRLGGALIGLFTAFPALLLIFLEPVRPRRSDAFLLLAGAMALASIGLAYIGEAEPWQIAFGYLMPASALVVAAALLALPAFGLALLAARRTPASAAE